MSAYLHRTVEMADGRNIRVEVRVAKLLKLLPQALEDGGRYDGHIAEGNVMGALITIGFVGLVLYVGKRMFSVRDWGEPTHSPVTRD